MRFSVFFNYVCLLFWLNLIPPDIDVHIFGVANVKATQNPGLGLDSLSFFCHTPVLSNNPLDFFLSFECDCICLASPDALSASCVSVLYLKRDIGLTRTNLSSALSFCLYLLVQELTFYVFYLAFFRLRCYTLGLFSQVLEVLFIFEFSMSLIIEARLY